MVENLRDPLSFLQPVVGGNPNLRDSLTDLSVVSGGNPNLRDSLTDLSVVSGGNPNLRMNLGVVQVVDGGNPKLRCSLTIIQVLIPILEELPVTIFVFPTARSGIAWNRTKSPSGNNARREMTSGKRSVTPFMIHPRWNFELDFEVAPDTRYVSGISAKVATIQSLVDLYKNTLFGAYTFLYHDPADYHVVGGVIATADGVTLQFPFLAPVMGTVLEPIGQVDLSQLAAFTSSAVNPTTDEINIPDHGFVTGQYPPMFITSDTTLPTPLVANTPYWPVVVDANNIRLATSYANALSNTYIDITAAGAGNDTLTKGYAIYDNGTIVNPSSASLTLPNQIVFGTAPTSGHAITADFDYDFVCRFDADKMDINEFAKSLHELQKLTFSSEV